MTNKTLTMLLFAGVIVGTFIGLSFKTDTVTYKNEVKMRHEIIAERTIAIYNSDVFQDEMMKLATARALFEMSNETQGGAVELSEMALIKYKQSQTLAKQWHNIE